MKQLYLYLTLVLLVILTGCATMHDPKSELAQFEVIGRTALKSPEQNGQASFVWKQNGPYIDLLVQGPLGKGRMDLQVTPSESTLSYDNQTYKDRDPDTLFFNITQINWPISGMKNWIVGTPNNAATQITYDHKQRIQSFNEAGWTIEYSQWMTYKNRDVPKIINIAREDIRIRLLIEHWKYR